MMHMAMTSAVFVTAVFAGLPVESNSETSESGSHQVERKNCMFKGVVLPDGFNGLCPNDCNLCECRNGVLVQTLCECEGEKVVGFNCIRRCPFNYVLTENCQCGVRMCLVGSHCLGGKIDIGWCLPKFFFLYPRY
eukprot:GEMP01116779.1.p1 GENE.GEMP01116779.1~~GEMP01116779.1.p1  ORF type:complete len:135 (+),score=14.39 GEMP01116779.1:70-474(+)